MQNRGELCTAPSQLVDVMPTLLEAAGARYPETRNGRPVPGPEGRSLLPLLRGEADQERTLFWEHEGNSAARRGRWKLVRKYGQDWELYDIEADRAEAHDLAAEHRDLVVDLSEAYETWAERAGVIPRDVVLDLYARRGHGLPEE